MPSFKGKRAYLALAVAAPLVLGVAEPALGHVTGFDGTMVVTGNAGGSATSVGYGVGSSCSTTGGGAQATSSGGSVGITVSPAPANGTCASVKLKTGTYGVFYLDNSSTTNSPTFQCVHYWNLLANPSLGTMHVSSTGNGSGTYALPNGLAVTPTNGATVCLSDMTKDSGVTAQIHGQAAYLTIVP